VPTGVRGGHSAPASFTALAGVRGVPLRVGRTLRALAATIDDISILPSPAILTTAGGGLRGGSWELHGYGRLQLRKYQAVPGVEVSGSLLYTDRSLRRGWRLRVTGTNAAHGTVELRTGGRVTGRLGGRKVRFTLVTSAAAAARAVAAAATARRPSPAARIP
jgi:hypothetical protein